MFSVKCIGQTNKGSKLWREVLYAQPALWLILLSLTGCGEKKAPGTKVTLDVTDEGLLSFNGGHEEDISEIERLNSEINKIADEYHETLEEDDKTWTVMSLTENGDRILQGTIYINRQETSLLGERQESRQLASFAYDLEQHRGFTALDALEEDPMTSVELATRTNKAFNTLEPEAQLLQTEMQGFVLNDNATTKFLYMRIESEIYPENQETQQVEEFYLYDPSIDAMAQIDWPIAE